MIPAFNDHGYLPPGVYPATLAEIEARFGQESEIRRVQMESIRWLVDLALLLCFSDAEPAGNGPRRVSRAELHQAFSKGWKIESIEPTHFEINPQSAELGFSPGGPKAWFATIRRI